MKKYLVKTTSVATDENPNFAGQVQICYYGKQERVLGMAGSHAKATHMESPLNLYLAREYGYNRKDHAKRAWSYRNPENTKYWTTEVDVIEVEV